MLLTMARKRWIVILLSFVIALLYSLPWLAFRGRPDNYENALIEGGVPLRVLYLFVVVFLTSLLFFYTNAILSKAFLERRRIVRRVLQALIQLIIVLAITVVLVLLSTVVLDVKAPKAYFVFYLLRNLILAAIVGLLTYVIDLIDRLDKERMEVLLLENKNTESELVALRNQIDPHFIFNTLSTLGGLIDPFNKKAMTFLEHLSNSFRYVMERRSDHLVPVREELEFLRSYLYMMNCRFGDSIRLTIRLEDGESRLLPQFALQIAVENAIKHNFFSTAYPLKISICQERDHLIVKNSVRKVKSVGYGIGLENLSKRYMLSGDENIEIRQHNEYFELLLPLL